MTSTAVIPSPTYRIATVMCLSGRLALRKADRLIATDTNIKVDDLDGSIWPTLDDVRRLGRRIYLGGRFRCPARTPCVREAN
jgi:hypothetical protein